jgi:hypothetical protein
VTVYGSDGSGEPTTFEVVHSSRFSMPGGLRSAAGFASSTGLASPAGVANVYAAATNAAAPATDHKAVRMGETSSGVRECRGIM